MNNIFSSFSSFYHNTNSSTLSGAIDIIVVKREDGLRCSPFRVRFGTLQMFRTAEKSVHLVINGVMTPIQMKIGYGGVLYFEREPVEEIKTKNLEISPFIIEKVREEKICNEPIVRDSELFTSLRVVKNNTFDVIAQEITKMGVDEEGEVEYKNIILEAKKGECPNGISGIIEKNLEEIRTQLKDEDINKNPELEGQEKRYIVDSKNFVEIENIYDKNEVPVKKLENVNENTNVTIENGKEKYEQIKSPEESTNTEEQNAEENKESEKEELNVEEKKICEKIIENKEAEKEEIKKNKKDQKILEKENEENKNEEKNFKDTAEKQTFYTLDEITKIRSMNYEKRMFSKRLMGTLSTYNSLFTCYRNFLSIFNSFEHMLFLLNHYRILYSCFKNLMAPIKCENKKNLTFKSCKDIRVRYSKSLDKKLVGSLAEVFEMYLTKDLTDSMNIVVEIRTCPNCGIFFYLPFQLYSEIFFSLSQEIVSSKSKMLDFLEKKCEGKKGWFTRFNSRRKNRTFVLKSEQLELLNLQEGMNRVDFKVDGEDIKLSARIFLWSDTDRIIVSDIDGTITKSDIRGHIYDMVGRDWTHVGVARLYSKIEKNGYRLLYLSSRAMGQYYRTVNLLKRIKQEDHVLPEGPVILSPDGIFAAIYREMILRRPEEFKIDCLKTIENLFTGKKPFVAGFGNRINDVMTYKALEIKSSRIFTTNPRGEVFLELHRTLVCTYETMTSFVDSMFPKYEDQEEKTLEDYTDHKYWQA